jgi:hypothetical protein
MVAVFALLERRLTVLDHLAASLEPSTATSRRLLTPAMHIVFVEQRTAAQCDLLADWARVEAALDIWRQRFPAWFLAWREEAWRGAGSAADTGARWQDYHQQYRRRLADLRWRCRVEAAVLQRSRRTAAALSALLLDADATYSVPGRGLAGVMRS